MSITRVYTDRTLQLLNGILLELESSQIPQGKVNELLLENQTAANLIFRRVWEVSGEPTPEKWSKVAHPQFGRVAFLDEEGRSIPTNKKIEIVSEILSLWTERISSPLNGTLEEQRRYLHTLASEDALWESAKWRLEALNDSLEESSPSETHRENFYPVLERIDATFRPSKLPFVHGRDRHLPATPYRYNQVRLSTGVDMNASEIKFPKTGENYLKAPTYCLAMSAPVPSYTLETLQMYEERGVGTVVNLTDFKEGNAIKADPYLPQKLGEVMNFVTNENTQTLGLSQSWTVDKRQFRVKMGEKEHQFTEFHLHGWKDFTLGEAEGIADLVEIVYRHQKQSSAGLLAVHCSAGIGRSGVFLLGKVVYERLLEGQDPDINKIAMQMRTQRHFLGGSEGQFRSVQTLKALFQTRLLQRREVES